MEAQLEAMPALAASWYRTCFADSFAGRFMRQYSVTRTDSNGRKHTSYYTALESRTTAPRMPWPFFVLPGFEEG